MPSELRRDLIVWNFLSEQYPVQSGSVGDPQFRPWVASVTRSWDTLWEWHKLIRTVSWSWEIEIASGFCQFVLNQIDNWHELNHVLRLIVHSGHHFHQSHLNQIHQWDSKNPIILATFSNCILRKQNVTKYSHFTIDSYSYKTNQQLSVHLSKQPLVQTVAGVDMPVFLLRKKSQISFPSFPRNKSRSRMNIICNQFKTMWQPKRAASKHPGFVREKQSLCQLKIPQNRIPGAWKHPLERPFSRSCCQEVWDSRFEVWDVRERESGEVKEKSGSSR
jgi:hypothetical protein